MIMFRCMSDELYCRHLYSGCSGFFFFFFFIFFKKRALHSKVGFFCLLPATIPVL